MCCFQLLCFVNSCESERTATKVMIMGVMAWHQTQKLMWWESHHKFEASYKTLSFSHEHALMPMCLLSSKLQPKMPNLSPFFFFSISILVTHDSPCLIRGNRLCCPQQLRRECPRGSSVFLLHTIINP